MLAGLCVLALVLALIVSHVVWFRWMGEYLVQEQAPVKAGMIVVLGGDLRGDRILKAASLAQQGFAPASAGERWRQHVRHA